MKKPVKILLTILLLPLILPLILLGLMIFFAILPFGLLKDWLLYRRSAYFRTFHTKYKALDGHREAVQLYERITKEKQAVDYVQNGEFEYFVKGDILLFPEYSSELSWVEEEQQFGVYRSEDDRETWQVTSLDGLIEECMAQVKEEHRSLTGRLLFFITESEDYEDGKGEIECLEKAKEDPRLYVCHSIKTFE